MTKEPLFLQLPRDLVLFDLETTGLNVQTDRIVQFAGLRFRAGGQGEHRTMALRVNPEIPIAPEATAVHGITDEQARIHDPLSAYAEDLRAFMNNADWGGFGVRRFDVPLILREMERVAAPLPAPAVILDCADLFHRREPRDLAAAVRFYCGHDIVGHHDALEDVHSCYDVLLGQLARYADLPRTPEAIAATLRDPDAVDAGGKLRRRGDKIVLAFGKHAGKALADVPSDYLCWLLDKDVVGPDGIPLIRKILEARESGPNRE